MQITPLHLIDHLIMHDPIPCYLDWYFPKLSWWHAASACDQLMTPSAIFVNLYCLDVTHSWCLVAWILHHQLYPVSGLSTKDLIQLKFDFPIFNPCRVILLRCRFKPEVAWPVVSLVPVVTLLTTTQWYQRPIMVIISFWPWSDHYPSFLRKGWGSVTTSVGWVPEQEGFGGYQRPPMRPCGRSCLNARLTKLFEGIKTQPTESTSPP